MGIGTARRGGASAWCGLAWQGTYSTGDNMIYTVHIEEWYGNLYIEFRGGNSPSVSTYTYPTPRTWLIV